MERMTQKIFVCMYPVCLCAPLLLSRTCVNARTTANAIPCHTGRARARHVFTARNTVLKEPLVSPPLRHYLLLARANTRLLYLDKVPLVLRDFVRRLTRKKFIFRANYIYFLLLL